MSTGRWKPDQLDRSGERAGASASRRSLLRLGLGGAALIAGTGPIAWPVPAQTATVRPTRLGIHTLALNHPMLETYRKGVAAMKALPASDKRSWSYWVGIHNKYCPHRNWYFLPWHRAYLVGLENIIRSLTKTPSFAVPYWDWTSLPRLPEAFTAVMWGSVANPLLDTTRLAAPTDTLPAELVGQPVMDAIYAVTDYELFGTSRPKGQSSLSSSWQRKVGVQGTLESTPHNGVHNWMGGNMATMLSPTDPLFYLHHANCDRIWASWIALGNSNSTDILWQNFVFTNNFVKPTKALYSVAVKDVLDLSILGYQYPQQGAYS